MPSEAPHDAQQIERRHVPAQALRFTAGPFRLAASQGESDPPFSMLARSADPIDHWYWGPLVHDFAGMSRKPIIPADYCHDPGEVLGFADQSTVETDGLHLSGRLTPFTADDRAAEIINKAGRKVPYEASIDFNDLGSLLLEFVPEGYAGQANGRSYQGPVTIARQWQLRGVAICPYGYDANTTTQLSADGATVPVVIYTQEGTMPQLSPQKFAAAAVQSADAPASATSAPADGQADNAPSTPAASGDGGSAPPAPAEAATDAPSDDDDDTAVETPPPPASDASAAQLSSAEQKLKQFVAKFGADHGGKWFAEGITFEAALERHADALTAQLTAAQGEQARLRQQIGAAQLGEAAPVSGGGSTPVDPAATQLSNAVGPNLAKVAAGMKLPGRTK